MSGLRRSFLRPRKTFTKLVKITDFKVKIIVFMFIIRWFLSFVDFFGDFDCFCTKLVIFMVKCRVCRGFLTCLRILDDSDDTMIYCLYRVWKWRGLKRWITWLINQNNWVGNSIMMMFSTKILTSFVTWIKKSSKNHQKTVKKVLCGCFVFWWFFDIIRWFSSFVEIFVDFDCFCIKLVIFMVTSRKTME